jgi:hypothetical protein
MNVVRYVQKTVFQWLLIAKDFKNYKLIHEIYMKWIKSNLINKINDILMIIIREKLGKDSESTIGILDSCVS